MNRGPRPHSAARLLIAYAALSLAVLVVVGLALAGSYRAEADRRGSAAGAALTQLVATSAVEPLLDGTDLRSGLPNRTDVALRRITTRAIANGSLLRLRVRDLDGRIVFSDDGVGEGSIDGAVDVLEAARGEVMSRVTRLESNRAGPGGEQGGLVVESHRPLSAGPVSARVGVLEVYLPYEPIRRDIHSGLTALYIGLALGLAVLYVVLAGLSFLITRRLRRQSLDNAYLAEHDQLTGLVNRRVFEQRLAEIGAGRGDPHAAVAVLDLDRFKDINDTIGHHGGDVVIGAMARRLSAGVGPHDLVARLGGDEFGVVLAGVREESDATAALHRLRDLVSAPLQVAGVPLATEVSIGYVLAPQDGARAELLQRADIAMYTAKTGHVGVVRYDRADDHYDSDRLALVGELRGALDRDELVLHYQPTLRLVDDAVVAVEALIRWNHPRHGLLYPNAFIPAAEQTGLIDPLTDWVVAAALSQLRAWDAAGVDLEVAVNVSARNLTSPGFAGRVLAAVAASGFGNHRLVLEVTETAMVTDIGRSTCALHQLDAAGIHIALDDFGQGQTSLAHLAGLPLTTLKIDRSFVTDMTSNRPHAAIVRSVIELAHNLGMKVVAEGVEDEVALQALRDLRCDIAQGYLLARPMTAERMVDWLREHRPVPVLR